MPVTEDRPAPYAPASAILEIIDRYRNRGLQNPITSDVLRRAGVTDSLVPRTMQALQCLDLVTEDGMPTQAFEDIRLAPESEFKASLEKWLNHAYADVIQFVDPATDDEVRIRDAFRTYSPIGQQPRMVSLFMALYAGAGIAPERDTTPQRQARTQRKKPSVAKARTPTSRQSTRGQNDFSNRGEVPAPLAGLLSTLPPTGEGWTQKERERFFATFSAVLDYCFPLKEEDHSKETVAEEETATA